MNEFTNGSLASCVPNDSEIFLKYILAQAITVQRRESRQPFTAQRDPVGENRQLGLRIGEHRRAQLDDVWPDQGFTAGEVEPPHPELT